MTARTSLLARLMELGQRLQTTENPRHRRRIENMRHAIRVRLVGAPLAADWGQS